MKRYRIQVTFTPEEYEVLRKHSELTKCPLGTVVSRYFRDGEMFKVIKNANALLESLQNLEEKGKFSNLDDDDLMRVIVKDLVKETKLSDKISLNSK